MEIITSLLTVPLPAGWFFKESITVLAPDGQANVIVSSEPLDPRLDTDGYAQAQGTLLAQEFPGFYEVSYAPISWLGGERAYLRHFTWAPPDGVPITQMQAYHAQPGRGFTATATTPSTSFHHLEATLREVLLGVVLTVTPGQHRSSLGGWSWRGPGRRS